MAIEKREQVFVSSTFMDLIDERRGVIQILLEANCIPVGMEMFPASNSQKFSLIKRVIDASDYYIVIVGGRYGSVDDAEQLSYTEMEYNYAIEKGIPVMGFLHSDAASIPVGKSESDPELIAKLLLFRAKIEERMVRYWSTPGDLTGQVAIAMIQIRDSDPAEGWIRASNAMTPEISIEIAHLQQKVAELTAALEREKRQHPSGLDTAMLAQGNDEMKLEVQIDFHWQDSIQEGRDELIRTANGIFPIPVTWNEILSQIGPGLMNEMPESNIKMSLSRLSRAKIRQALLDDKLTSQLVRNLEEDDEEHTDESRIRIVGHTYGDHVTDESFQNVKVQLIALGLLERGEKPRSNSDRNTYWKLTETGHHSLLNLSAIRRTPAEPAEEPEAAPAV